MLVVWICLFFLEFLQNTEQGENNYVVKELNRIATVVFRDMV